MVLELIGTRIVAPYIGSSLYVWTSLIGVVLGFLSLGYYWGGLISEKNASYKKLSVLIMGSAMWVFFVALTKEIVMDFVLKLVVDRYIQSILAASIFFGVPSFLLGAVSPYAVRLAISSVTHSGKIVGKIYSLSTMGSIAGTFLTGFLLVPYLGHLKTLYVVVLVLLLVSVALSRYLLLAKVFCIVICSTALLQGWVLSGTNSKQTIIDVDTAYGRVQIYEVQTHIGKVRGMYIDGAYSSAIAIDDPKAMLLNYYPYYNLMFWNTLPSNVLMIGGAGMGYPRHVLASHPNIYLTVVEIDEQVYDIAQKTMGFVPSNRLKMIFEDGRTFLHTNKVKYDAVLFDVFSGYTLPWYLVTREALIKVRESLVDDGMVIINIVGALEGPQSLLTRAITTTSLAVFDEVEIFATAGVSDTYQIQNLIVVAAKQQLNFERNSLTPLTKSLLRNRTGLPSGTQILTDDRSPLDAYTAIMTTRSSLGGRRFH